MKPRRKYWYSANVILVFRLRTGRQREYPVWENVYLIKAASEEEARSRAEELGRAEADHDGIELNGKPANVVFGGVRKVMLCAADPEREGDSSVVKLYDGVEATFSSFVVKGKSNLQSLIGGRAVELLYEE